MPASTTPLRRSVHLDHVHPKWGVEQIGWIGQTGEVYALDDFPGAEREPGGYGPLFQARDESCGHADGIAPGVRVINQYRGAGTVLLTDEKPPTPAYVLVRWDDSHRTWIDRADVVPPPF